MTITDPEVFPWPSTPLEAAKLLIDALSLEDRIAIANMGTDEVAFLNLSLGNYIRKNFGLWEGNVVLMQACAEEADRKSLNQDEASAVIIARLALYLKINIRA